MTGIAVSPDGQTVLSSSADHTLILWDTGTGAEVQRLTGHTAAVTTVVFSPDGSKLYTAGLDGVMRVYLMDIEELLMLGRSRLTRSLTPEECQTYLRVNECPEGP